jgi:hypothetical protein
MSSARCPYLPLFCKLLFLRGNAFATCRHCHAFSCLSESLHPINHALDTRASGAATQGDSG